MPDRFRSVLVANRGEIACRVMRTAKALGYRVLAIASEADRDAPHVRMADDVRVIGPGPVGQSYLDQDRVLTAAKEMGAEAIHPGYGFLSENAGFVRRVREAGLVFIGPSPEAVDLMGDKARAKRAMIEAGVPCIPGYEGEAQDTERFVKAAEEAGYPVMVKAAAGGGGRGMRMVREPSALPAALGDARSEAESAFGSGDLILEKAVENARHIEIQVFGDSHGNIIHLGERDCSFQRRHQKVVEEAPSPAVSEELRTRMGEAAVAAARAVAYEGAGTVEFLLADDGAFYFLEMNTRLQVEHPVTEEITGLDLVALQLRVAQGEPLGVSQDDVELRGHSIEVRLYAEDPFGGFLPSTGDVALWKPPAGVRVDAGIESGSEVTPHYDPMVAKVIATASDRKAAIRKLTTALGETVLLGLTTNRTYLSQLVASEIFAEGEARTTTLDRGEIVRKPETPSQLYALAAAVQYSCEAGAVRQQARIADELAGWSSSGRIARPYLYEDGEVRCEVTSSGRELEVRAADESWRVTVHLNPDGTGRSRIDGATVDFSYAAVGSTIMLATATHDLSLDNSAARIRSKAEAAGAGAVTASMHGLVQEVGVNEGDHVTKGQRLGILEAMKMQHEITASVSGTVKAVAIKPGDQVGGGALLIEIEPDTEE